MDSSFIIPTSIALECFRSIIITISRSRFNTKKFFRNSKKSRFSITGCYSKFGRNVLDKFIYPLVMTNSLLLKMTIEIVDFPMKNGGSFHSYVNVYQGVLIAFNGPPLEFPDQHWFWESLVHVAMWKIDTAYMIYDMYSIYP